MSNKAQTNWAEEEDSSEDEAVEIQPPEEVPADEVTKADAEVQQVFQSKIIRMPPYIVTVKNIPYYTPFDAIGDFFCSGGCIVAGGEMLNEGKTASVEFEDANSLELALTANGAMFENRRIYVEVKESRNNNDRQRGPPNPNHRRDPRDPRDQRDHRGQRDHRDQRDYRDQGDARDGNIKNWERQQGPPGHQSNRQPNQQQQQQHGMPASDVRNQDRRTGGGASGGHERAPARREQGPNHHHSDQQQQAGAANTAADAPPAERKKLNILPRTKPIEAIATPKAAIFGEGKPQNGALYEEERKKKQQSESVEVVVDVADATHSVVAAEPTSSPSDEWADTRSKSVPSTTGRGAGRGQHAGRGNAGYVAGGRGASRQSNAQHNRSTSSRVVETVGAAGAGAEDVSVGVVVDAVEKLTLSADNAGRKDLKKDKKPKDKRTTVRDKPVPPVLTDEEKFNKAQFLFVTPTTKIEKKAANVNVFSFLVEDSDDE